MVTFFAISYCETFKDLEKDWKNHGRRAAHMVRLFLEELGFAPERINDICYGIAIHVDGEADFEGERTPFAEKLEKVNAMLRRLHELKEMKLGTQTATVLWKERVTYYISFYEKLKAQLEKSTSIE